MGFVDYFLIVYDYVKYAKKNDIFVGSGRGSAAGSLVSYSIGITNIDPLKYNLLFERFLNPGRITMPDIDVDFEDTKRDKVVEYIKNKYGNDYVAPIITYGTLSARQVLKDVATSLGMEEHIQELTKLIDSKLSLKDNLNNKEVKHLLSIYSNLDVVYKTSYKLEGLKRHISTHAAGVVISSVKLDEVMPICVNNGNILTGFTMSYLEELGILKMDLLSITNLTIIHNILDLMNNKIDINNIPIDDKKTYDMFSNGDTLGVFQFESNGMKNLLSKLKPRCFSDLYAAIALFRPGPMNNIDSFIKRKNGVEKIDYMDSSLKDILDETYGIIVYQEQIMYILVRMASYSFSEADNIRKAMSKKKEDIILKEKDTFINRCIKNGYSKTLAIDVYEKILKFANYGFNKAHSVSYALIGYQMGYLKANYFIYFIVNLLNMNIGDDNKTKEYINLAKQHNIEILKPDINLSVKNYKVGKNKLRLPLQVIKNIGSTIEDNILEEREKKPFSDFFDFVSRTYSKGVNKKIIEALIYSSSLDSFGNRKTLFNNIDSALKYAELTNSLDESLVSKPVLEEYSEFNSKEIMEHEFNSYGFYISNHPASKYSGKDIVKLSQLRNFFNKFVKTVVIINNVKEIRTKKGDRMCFLTGSDETGTIEFVVFSNNINEIKDVSINSLVVINGLVQRRFDKYQISVNKIDIL